MRLRSLSAAAAAAALTVPFGAVVAHAGADGPTSLVTLVHGLQPAGDVDMFLTAEGDDFDPEADLLLDDFAFGESIPRTPLLQGSYSVVLYPGDAATTDDDGNVTFDTSATPALGPVDLTVGTDDMSVVAQLDATGAPTVAVYQDDYSPAPADNARVSVRHAAGVGPVTIRVDETVVTESLANGSQLDAELPADSYDVTTFLAETMVLLPGLSTGVDDSDPGLAVEVGRLYALYAVGTDDQTDDADLQLLPVVSEIANESAPDTPTTGAHDDSVNGATTSPVIPTAVPAGDGTSGGTGSVALPALIVLGLAAVAAAVATLAVRGAAARR